MVHVAASNSRQVVQRRLWIDVQQQQVVVEVTGDDLPIQDAAKRTTSASKSGLFEHQSQGDALLWVSRGAVDTHIVVALIVRPICDISNGFQTAKIAVGVISVVTMVQVQPVESPFSNGITPVAEGRATIIANEVHIS